MMKRFLFFILALVALIFFLPSLLSQHWIHKQMLSSLNKQIPGTVSADSLSLSWFGRQRLHGFVLKDTSGTVVLEVEDLVAHIPLRGLLSKQIDLGLIELISPKVNVLLRKDGSNTLQEALLFNKQRIPSAATAPLKEVEKQKEKETPKNYPSEKTGKETSLAPTSLTFSGRMKIRDGQFHIMGSNGAIYDFDNIDLDASLKDQQNILFSLIAQGTQGTFSAGGNVHLDGKGPLLEANAKLVDVPILDLLDAFDIHGKIREQIAALVGEKITFEAKARFSNVEHGELSAYYTGSNSTFEFKGHLDNGVLYLDEDCIISLQVNPNLSRLLLKNINPLLVTAVAAEQPLRVTINAKGFEAPLFPFNLTAINIPKIQVDIGKVILNNGGPTAALLSFLKASSLEQEPQLQAWFTPQYLFVKNDILTVSRVDFLLADTFHLAYWGDITLSHNRLNLKLGITGPVLKQAFGLSNLKKDEMLIIPIKGTTDRPDIKISSATTQIATIIAKEQTGEIGRIVDSVLNTTTLGLFSKEVPPPTTQPFPWGERRQEATVTPSTQQPSPLKKPLKEAEKSVKNLFKNLF